MLTALLLLSIARPPVLASAQHVDAAPPEAEVVPEAKAVPEAPSFTDAVEDVLEQAHREGCEGRTLDEIRDYAHRQHLRERLDGTAPTCTEADVEAAETRLGMMMLEDDFVGRKSNALPRLLGLGSGAKAAEAADELLSIVTEIALDRARHRGLALVQEQINEAVCELRIPAELTKAGTAIPALPATCELLRGTSIEQIAGDPQLLRAPLFSDLLEAIGHTVIDEVFDAAELATLRPMVELGSSIVARSVASRRVVFTTQDARSMLSAWRRYFASRTDWGQGHCGLAVGLEVTTTLLDRPGETRTVSDLVDAYYPKDVPCLEGTRDGYAVALELATLADRALRLSKADLEDLADGAKDDKAKRGGLRPDVQQRVRAAVQLGFFVTQQLQAAPTDDAAKLRARRLELLETLLLAAVDQNAPEALSAATNLLLTATRPSLPRPAPEQLCSKEDDATKRAAFDKERAALVQQLTALAPELATKIPAFDAEKCATKARELRSSVDVILEDARMTRRRAEKASALLSAITSYAATYQGNTERTPEQLREARTEAVEGLIDATTIRTNRHGEAVWSIGIPVGFIAGGQWVAQANAQGPERSWMPPQLSVPFGVAFQVLPGRRMAKGRIPPRKVGMGLHAMGTAIDLGQYASYDEDGDINRPRWDSLLAPGAQLGVLLGSPQHTFVIAADLRYAPTLFATTNDLDLQGQRGGAFRVGATVSYYVSFFDFN